MKSFILAARGLGDLAGPGKKKDRARILGLPRGSEPLRGGIGELATY